MDLYRRFAAGDKSEQHLVRVERSASFAAIVVAMLVARPLLGALWKRMTTNAALVTTIGSAAFSIGIKLLVPSLPFIDRVGVVFLACLGAGVLVSLAGKPEAHPNAIDYGAIDTSTTTGFNLGAGVVLPILIALYASRW